MRGVDQTNGSLFSYVSLEDRVPPDHSLRAVRGVVNDVLSGLSGEFEKLYSRTGRPSIPPEQLLRALLLQAFYTIRSERQLMEQLDFNLLFRWFVGLAIDDGVWDASVFCKNRDRFLKAGVSAQLLSGVVRHKKVRRLLSRDHFSVDGTLIEAWASMKSFRPAAPALVDRYRPGRRRITLAGDKGLDVASLADDLRGRRITPHLAVDGRITRTGKRRRIRIDGRTTQHACYQTSQRIRKRIEEIFGWVKVQGGQRQTRFRGRHRVEASFVLALAACNLARLPRLLAAAPPP